MWGNVSKIQPDAGGFLNTTANQDETENKGASWRNRNVVPLVIKQIKNCTGEDFKLFGASVEIIKLVGIVRTFEVQSTKATYTLDDHTGSIKATLWLDNDDGTVNLPSVKEDSYFQVFGSLRPQDGEKKIIVLKMVPVHDCNIITTHLLEAVYARLSAEADSKQQISDIKLNNPGASLINSMSFVDDDSGAGNNSGLTPLQQKVFKLLQTDQTVNGMSRDVLLTKFPPNQHKQINETLQFLSNEGHVYSTIDSDHFKVTIM